MPSVQGTLASSLVTRSYAGLALALGVGALTRPPQPIEPDRRPAILAARAICPDDPLLEPGPRAAEEAVAAVQKSLSAGPLEWRDYEIRAAYPASRREGFGLVVVGMCGQEVANRTWIVELHFPRLEPSASLSQGQAFVSRFASGWRVWYRYH